MQTEPSSEPTGSPPVIPHEARPDNPRRTLLAKVLSVLRGDKYMVGAYPPGWHERSSVPNLDKTQGR